jgi:hypothetical protein
MPMTKYLLTCNCGANLPVEVGQAGERVTCQCGAMLEVPPLRKMRHLPQAAATVAESTAWNPRRGVVAALAILAAVLGLIALWSRLTEPKVAEFEPEAHTRNVEERLSAATPLQAWQDWVQYYSQLGEHGFFEFVDSRAPVIQQEVTKRRFLQRTLVGTAAVLIVVAAVAAFWPAAQARRHGDKETSRTR